MTSQQDPAHPERERESICDTPPALLFVPHQINYQMVAFPHQRGPQTGSSGAAVMTSRPTGGTGTAAAAAAVRGG